MSCNRLFLLLFVIPAISAYDKEINTTASSGSGTDQSSVMQSSSADDAGLGFSFGAFLPSSSAAVGASGSGKSSGGSSSDGSGSLYTWQWILVLTALCCCKVMCLGACGYAFCDTKKKKKRAVAKKKTRPPAMPVSPPASVTAPMPTPLQSPPSPIPTTASLIPSYSMLNTRRPPEVAPSPAATVQLAAPPAATGYAGMPVQGYAPLAPAMAMPAMAAPQAYTAEAYAATTAYNPAMTAMTAPMAATSGYPGMAAPMMQAPMMAAAPVGYAAPAATSYSQVAPGYAPQYA